MECCCLVKHGLPLRGVHDQYGVVGLHGFLYLLHFFKEGVFLLVSPRSIDDNDLLNTHDIHTDTVFAKIKTKFSFNSPPVSQQLVCFHRCLEKG